MTLGAGTRLGVHEILAPIGVGGMGEVYRARDTRLKRDVAIKVLPDAWARDADRLARFEREAELLATLNHPNIAAIYGFEDVAGTKALVLELVEGPTLAEKITKGLAFAEALDIARQIADALDAAHERGIVHRDLKPANIKVREDGTVKVLDFGLAKALEPAAASQLDMTASPTMTSPLMTRMGVILGTAAYMSPEQARGQAIDKRTDIWAFGCVLYEMLTGRTAFGRTTVPDTIAAILEREPDWSLLPASTPSGIRRLLRRCIDRDRKRRLRDIGDAQTELENASGGQAQIETSAMAGPRRWTTALAMVAVLGSLAAITVVVWSRARPQQAPADSSLGAQLIRLTWDTGFSTEPALSRDGTLAVYASDRAGDGQLDLWLQRISGGQPIRLTSDPADDREPDFSSDGSLVVFRSDRADGGIYVMPTLGGDARLIAERGHAPRFSPDGALVAYWTGPWLGGPRSRGSAVFLVPANGGQPRPIADGFVAARNPVWAPDGRSLLFFGRKSSEELPADTAFDWWWISVDGGEAVPTGVYQLLADAGLGGTAVNNTVNPAPDELPSSWTKEGVLFSARLGESINLWRVQVSDRGQVISGSLARLTSGAGSDLLPVPDGQERIAFQVSSESVVSLTLPLEPNAARVLAPVGVVASDAGVETGRNSLDHVGRLLAHVKTRARESEIWVKDLATGQDRHVVTTPRSQLNPIISHDGTKIAYTIPEGGGISGYLIAATGGTAKKVCDRCLFQGWLSDNRRILTLNDVQEPGGHLRVVDVVNDAAEEAIVDPTSRIGRADVSHDNRWLAFLTRGRVWVAPLHPGSPPRESEWVPILTVAPGAAERACGWSPDGRLLYLLLERDGFRDLYAQKIDVGRGTPVGDPFVVQHLHDPRRRWGSTPSGNAIARNAFVFHQVEMTGGIWLLDPNGRR